jgi:hypothetical protein
MDKEIIGFLQNHNLLNHKGACDPSSELITKVTEGKITEKEYLDQAVKCHKTCPYYVKRGMRISMSETGRITTHCFRNISHAILEGENEDYSGTFVYSGPIKKEG